MAKSYAQLKTDINNKIRNKTVAGSILKGEVSDVNTDIVDKIQEVAVPPGGIVGQVLKKTSNSDYALAWQDESGGGGGGSVTWDTLPGKPVIGTAASQPASAFATSSQGAKADLAIQPGANISRLNNDLNLASQTYVNNKVAQIEAIAATGMQAVYPGYEPDDIPGPYALTPSIPGDYSLIDSTFIITQADWENNFIVFFFDGVDWSIHRKPINGFDTGKNLYNFLEAEDNTTYDGNGVAFPNVNTYSSAIIIAKPSTNYVASVDDPAVGFVFVTLVLFYDASMGVISFVENPSGNTFTTPVSCEYIRVVCGKTVSGAINITQIEEGSVATEYTKFGFVNPNQRLDVENVNRIEQKIDDTVGFVRSKNLLLLEELEPHKVLNGSGQPVTSPDSRTLTGFLPCKPNTNYKASAGFGAWSFILQRAFYNKNKEFIFLGGVPADNTWLSPAGSTVAYQRLVFVVDPIDCETIQIEEGTVATTYTPGTGINKPDLRIFANQILGLDTVLTPTITTVTAVQNANNWNSIRDICNGLVDASEYKKYIVYVPNGTWNETDWQGWGDHIRIIGQSREYTIINCDGTDTNPTHILPSDYSMPGEAGKQIAAASSNQVRHLLFVKKNTWIENLTLKTKSGKYVAHIDNSLHNNVYLFNCKLISDLCNNTVGIGVWEGQSITFRNCIIRELNAGVLGFPIYFHNTNNRPAGSKTMFDGCLIDGITGIVYTQELGSDRDDQLIFNNCTTTDPAKRQVFLGVATDTDGKTFWTNPATGIKASDPQSLPYNINLIFTNTPVSEVGLQNWGFAPGLVHRPDWASHSILIVS
ncbi:hypothetical protein ACLOAU_14700 [Niabella sp. CJ426]|uniref:hypothetical protein n=1 Tax=Niabella sp. CJ426 TaxID=3393740 RepID=UPI003D00D113